MWLDKFFLWCFLYCVIACVCKNSYELSHTLTPPPCCQHEKIERSWQKKVNITIQKKKIMNERKQKLVNKLKHDYDDSYFV